MDASKPAQLELEGLTCFNVQEFTRADWELVANQFMQPEFVQEQAESVIDQIFDYMKAEDDTTGLAIQISVSQFKDLFSGDEGFAFYQSITASKRSCGLMDIASIGLWLMNPQSSCLAICKPIIDINKNIWDIVTSFSDMIPTEYDLNNFINTQPLERLRPLFRLTTMLQTASLILLAAAVLFLPLTWVSRKARSIRGSLLFWGLPLAIAGLIVLLIAIVIPLTGRWLVSDFATTFDVVAGLEALIGDVTGQITITLAKTIGLPGAALLLVGGLMTVISLVMSFVAARR